MFTRRTFLRFVAGGSAAWLNPAIRAQVGGQREGGGEKGSLLNDAATWREFRAAMAKRPGSAAVLGREADQWLHSGLITVVHKKTPGPTGDPHDYVSLAPYRWPDPGKPDGLPWIDRDGQVNPVFYDYDNPDLERLCRAVPWLLLHAEAAGSLPHARRAGRLLRAWFLDPETRMNPHLRFAQKVPGLADGTPGGIIDTTSLVFLADAASRLAFNADWTAAHLAGVKEWFGRYVDWLLTSEAGQKEGSAMNNHGSWYDA